jgi:hypothetical protein
MLCNSEATLTIEAINSKLLLFLELAFWNLLFYGVFTSLKPSAVGSVQLIG